MVRKDAIPILVSVTLVAFSTFSSASTVTRNHPDTTLSQINDIESFFSACPQHSCKGYLAEPVLIIHFSS
jgi:hypothetical protein